MSGRPKNPAYARNKNVLVVGRFRKRQDSVFHKTEPDAAPQFLCGDRSKGNGISRVRKDAPKRQPEDRKKTGNRSGIKKGKIIYEPFRIKVFNTINFKEKYAL